MWSTSGLLSPSLLCRLLDLIIFQQVLGRDPKCLYATEEVYVGELQVSTEGHPNGGTLSMPLSKGPQRTHVL